MTMKSVAKSKEAQLYLMRRALKKWNLFIQRQSAIKSALMLSAYELRAKEVLYRYSLGNMLLSCWNFWRVTARMKRRKKRWLFMLLRKRRLTRRLICNVEIRVLRHYFHKLRRRVKWPEIQKMYHGSCERLMASLLSRWNYWFNIRLRSYSCRIKAEYYYNRVLYLKGFFALKIRAVLASKIGHSVQKRHEQQRLKSIKCFSLFLHRCSRSRWASGIASQFFRKKKLSTSISILLLRWRRLKARDNRTRKHLKLHVNNINHSGATLYQFQNDSVFFLYGRGCEYECNVRNRAALFAGCLSHFSRKVHEWSRCSIFMQRVFVLWKRRNLVKINQRIRGVLGLHHLLSCHLKYWKKFQHRSRRSRSSALVAKLYVKRFHFNNFVSQWRQRRLLHFSAICHWGYSQFKKSLRSWLNRLLHARESYSKASFLQKKKALTRYKKFMKLKRFRIANLRSKEYWIYNRMKDAFMFWRSSAAIVRFAAVKCRFRHIIESSKSLDEVREQNLELMRRFWGMWKEHHHQDYRGNKEKKEYNEGCVTPHLTQEMTNPDHNDVKDGDDANKEFHVEAITSEVFDPTATTAPEDSESCQSSCDNDNKVDKSGSSWNENIMLADLLHFSLDVQSDQDNRNEILSYVDNQCSPLKSFSESDDINSNINDVEVTNDASLIQYVNVESTSKGIDSLRGGVPAGESYTTHDESKTIICEESTWIDDDSNRTIFSTCQVLHPSDLYCIENKSCITKSRHAIAVKKTLEDSFHSFSTSADVNQSFDCIRPQHAHIDRYVESSFLHSPSFHHNPSHPSQLSVLQEPLCSRLANNEKPQESRVPHNSRQTHEKISEQNKENLHDLKKPLWLNSSLSKKDVCGLNKSPADEQNEELNQQLGSRSYLKRYEKRLEMEIIQNSRTSHS